MAHGLAAVERVAINELIKDGQPHPRLNGFGSGQFKNYHVRIDMY